MKQKQPHGKRKTSRPSARAPQDPMVRAAAVLKRAGVPASRIPRTMRELARLLAMNRSDQAQPHESSNRHVLVRVRSETTVAEIRALSPARSMDEASAHFERALALEESDVEAAREAYAEAVATHGEHVEARINLGRLLHLNGELVAAEDVYRAAGQGSALVAFNLALVLEDLGRDEEAVCAYRESLALDPTLHEAHLNLGFLYERQQCPREALRHMLAFRRGAPDS